MVAHLSIRVQNLLNFIASKVVKTWALGLRLAMRAKNTVIRI